MTQPEMKEPSQASACMVEMSLLFSQQIHAARAEHAKACKQLSDASLAVVTGLEQPDYGAVAQSLENSAALLANIVQLLPSIGSTFAEHEVLGHVSTAGLQKVDEELQHADDFGRQGWQELRSALRDGGYDEVFTLIGHDCGILHRLSGNLAGFMRENLAKGSPLTLYAVLSAQRKHVFWKEYARLHRIWMDMQERMLLLHFVTRVLLDPNLHEVLEPDLFETEASAAAQGS